MKPLETERLLLRKFTPDDFDAVHSYASNSDNVIYMPFGPNTENETRAFMDRTLRKYEANPVTNYAYAAVLKETGTLIGGCELDLRDDSTAEIGWIVHRDYWGQGLGTEMGKQMLTLGFGDLNLHRIVAHCDAENTGSYRLMEKLGMRREGLFFDVRPPHKKSTRDYGDELCYAILKSEWEMQKEIAYYNSLPYEFNGFIDIPTLTNGEISVICTEKYPANPEKKHVPAYNCIICKNGEQIGLVNLRIGYSDGLYYCGQVGYAVDEAHRGNSYASEACKLLLPIARAHKMSKLIITNNVTNTASRRVCEKLGAKLIRVARLPEWTDQYKGGQRFVNIFEWNV